MSKNTQNKIYLRIMDLYDVASADAAKEELTKAEKSPDFAIERVFGITAESGKKLPEDYRKGISLWAVAILEHRFRLTAIFEKVPAKQRDGRTILDIYEARASTEETADAAARLVPDAQDFEDWLASTPTGCLQAQAITAIRQAQLKAAETALAWCRYWNPAPTSTNPGQPQGPFGPIEQIDPCKEELRDVQVAKSNLAMALLDESNICRP